MKRLTALVLVIVLALGVSETFAAKPNSQVNPRIDFDQHKEWQTCKVVSKNTLACVEATLNNDGGLEDGWAIADLSERVRNMAYEHPCWVNARKAGRNLDTGVKVRYYEFRIRIEIVAMEECK